MDQFPEHINRHSCTTLIRDVENNLMRETIMNFTNNIEKSIMHIDYEIELKFPDKLPSKHRMKIANMLLEKFGKLKIKDVNGDFTSSKVTDNKDDINRNIDTIFIEL